MKALILRSDAQAAVATSRALIDKGFQILCVESQAVAHALVRIDTIDLLVMDERVQGQLTHAIALSGERRNPYLSAILLTDRAGEDTDDLYGLIPSLYALAGNDTLPDMLARLAMSAVTGLDAIAARVAATVAEDQLEKAMPAEFDALDVAEETITPEVFVLDQVFAVSEVTGAPAPTAPVAEICDAGSPRLERVEDIVLREVAALFAAQAMPHPRATLLPDHHALLQEG